MQHKIIKTDSYLLVVGDDEIKEGDWMYQGIINHVRKYLGALDNIDVKRPSFKDHKKIIAHLPLNNSPILQGVDLLPDLKQEDDVEALAESQYGTDIDSIRGSNPYDLNSDLKRGFIRGYNKAKEKYKYTEEDIRKAIEMARTLVEGKNEFDVENILGSSDGTYGIKEKYSETKIIQSFSQPKMPVGFECRDKQYRVKSGTIEEHTQGNAGYEYYQWIGEWIY